MDGDFSDQTNQNWIKYRDLTVGFSGLRNEFKREEKRYRQEIWDIIRIRKVL